MIKLSIDRRVNRTYNGLLQAACQWLKETQSIPHQLKVTFFTDKNMREFVRAIDYPEKHALGIFFLHTRDIIIRNRNYKKIKVLRNGRQYRHELDTFLYVLMHEFVHYEQCRDKKSLNHRNVESRAKNLVRQFKCYFKDL